MKYLLTFSCILTLILISSTPTAAQEMLEQKLASIDAGIVVSTSHVNVIKFRTLLKNLSYTYVENRQQISDMTVKAQQVLKEKGISESLLNMMEGMNQLFSKKIDNQKYAEYIAAYMALRMDGQSHSKAIVGLNALLESMGVY